MVNKFPKIIFSSSYFLYIILLFQISSPQETSQNILCSSVPFCQRLMYSSESQVPLYFLDNKTIQIKIKIIYLKL